jgi:hypothetical protein
MHSRDAVAPLPVNAMPREAKKAWSVPSSPTPPCTATKTTAFSASARAANARSEKPRDEARFCYASD